MPPQIKKQWQKPVKKERKISKNEWMEQEGKLHKGLPHPLPADLRLFQGSMYQYLVKEKLSHQQGAHTGPWKRQQPNSGRRSCLRSP